MENIRCVIKPVLLSSLVFIFILSSLASHAVDSIKINTYTDYPPYLHVEKGQQTGLYMRIIDLTFKAIKQPYTIQIVPFKRGLYRTEEGDGIMIAVLKTQQRMQTLDFSEPYYQEKISFYFNKQQSPLVKTIDELAGLNIGTLLGWSYGEKFDQAKAENQLFTHDSKLETNFNLLAKGRLDAVVHTELSAVYVLNKLALKDKVFLASEPLALGNIHMAVKKGSHKELLHKFNQKLREPTHKKTINRLIKSYQSGFPLEIVKVNSKGKQALE